MINVRPLDSYVDAARRLQEWLRNEGFSPAEGALVIGVLHAGYLVAAQREGKSVTVADYTESYREALELWLRLFNPPGSPLGSLDKGTPLC